MARISDAEAQQIALAAGFVALEPYPGNRQAPWRVRCSGEARHEFKKTLALLQKKTGCKHCKNLVADPKTAAEDCACVGLVLVGEYKNARTPVLVRCKEPSCNNGEPFTVLITNVRKGHGCKFCAGRAVNPDQAREFMISRGLDPIVDYPGAGKPWLCRCKRKNCGAIVAPSYSNVRLGRGCIECSGRAPLTPEKANRVLAAKLFESLEPFPGRNEYWTMKCQRCDNVQQRTYRMAKRNGCKYCDKQGIDYNGPGYLYVLTHKEHAAVKIGIAGDRAQRSRVQILGRDGWKLYKKHSFTKTQDAYEVEQAVLDQLVEARGFFPLLTNELMRQHGATETFSDEDINAETLWQLALEIATANSARLDEDAN